MTPGQTGPHPDPSSDPAQLWADIERLQSDLSVATKRAEDAEYARERWKGVATKQPDFEKLWEAAEHRAATAEADVSKLDYVLDVLGIADSERDPADCVKEWITRAEAAQSALQEALAREARLRSALEDVQQYLRTGVWTRSDGVDNIISQSLSTTSPSTRTAALIRAGEAAVEETRAWASMEIGPREAQEASAARRKACAAIIEKEKSDG